MLAAMPNTVPAVPARFPAVSGKLLSGTELHLPAELPAQRTVLVLAFEREQQENVDTWTRGLGLKSEGGDVAWLEVPVIQNPGALARWFIDSGMRRGIKDHAAWNHVITLYLDKAQLLQPLGITDEKKVYALVVDRNGTVVARVAGDYSSEGAATIRQALAGQ